ISLSDADRFVRFARRLKNEICLHMPLDASTPPSDLPQYIHEFLSCTFDLTPRDISLCWYALKDLAWEADNARLSREEIALFLRNGGGKTVCNDEHLGMSHVPTSKLKMMYLY